MVRVAAHKLLAELMFDFAADDVVLYEPFALREEVVASS